MTFNNLDVSMFNLKRHLQLSIYVHPDKNKEDIDKLPKIIDQSWRITPIRKIPHIKPKPRPNGKIEKISFIIRKRNRPAVFLAICT